MDKISECRKLCSEISIRAQQIHQIGFEMSEILSDNIKNLMSISSLSSNIIGDNENNNNNNVYCKRKLSLILVFNNNYIYLESIII